MAVNLTSERVRTALACSRASAPGRAWPTCSATSSSAACTTATPGRGRQVHLQAAQGLSAARRPAEVDQDRGGRADRGDRGAQRDRRPRARRAHEGDGQASLSVRQDGVCRRRHAAEAAAINAEADRLLESHDAVADLALSEGVYQAVLGNYDRVASTYDAYARGNFPPEPDVVRTPLNGIGLTHRVALHLEPAPTPTFSPVAGLAMTPRAQASRRSTGGCERCCRRSIRSAAW